MQKNIRYASLSASQPAVFIYLAVKKATELQSFLGELKERFADIIAEQRYFFSVGQEKYELFPAGLLE